MTFVGSAVEPKLEPLTNAKQVEAVLSAVNSFDLINSSAWSDLDILSSHTHFEELDADRAGIFLRGDGTVEVAGVVYVTLQYGAKDDTTSMSDSYPAKITGHFDANLVFKIEDVTVDTFSFYE